MQTHLSFFYLINQWQYCIAIYTKQLLAEVIYIDNFQYCFLRFASQQPARFFTCFKTSFFFRHWPLKQNLSFDILGSKIRNVKWRGKRYIDIYIYRGDPLLPYFYLFACNFTVGRFDSQFTSILFTTIVMVSIHCTIVLVAHKITRRHYIWKAVLDEDYERNVLAKTVRIVRCRIPVHFPEALSTAYIWYILAIFANAFLS